MVLNKLWILWHELRIQGPTFARRDGEYQNRSGGPRDVETGATEDRKKEIWCRREDNCLILVWPARLTGGI